MPAVAVIGAQWGDEGKGKVIDFLAPQVDWAVRYQGGANAGHTVVVRGEKTVLHLVPSAILDPRVRCALASGVVVDPLAFLAEVALLESNGVAVRGRLVLSHGCHLVLPHHQAIDRAAERRRGALAIGTTGRGIGPAYAERATRQGIRAGEVRDAGRFADRLAALSRDGNEVLTKLLGAEPLGSDALEPFRDLPGRLAPFLADVGRLTRDALSTGGRVLLEGAQGTMLDLDHGTYPFVTSSNTTAAAAPASVGIPAAAVESVLAVIKAYTTRVGAGPFPTEIDGEEGDTLVARGAEFGATTGRRRRVGWFDAPAARHAMALNGATRLAITKLDVLDVWDSIPVCVAYEARGERLESFPEEPGLAEECRPVLERMPGWKAPTAGARSLDGLPRAARAYLDRLSELVDTPIGLISVGSGREETFCVGGDLFAPLARA